MIRPSPELLAVSRRWHQAIVDGNTGILAGFMSRAAQARFIGTAENEYWNGAVIAEGVGDFFGDVPDLLLAEEVEAEAFENGETGWSSFVHRIHFSGLPEPGLQRTTLVFVLEGAAWKIIQRHGSVPVPNVVHMGVEQTPIQRLANAARDEGPDLDQTHGLASVLFTDVVGSTRLASALGDSRWSALINAHFSRIGGIVAAQDGQFVKSLGDGTLSSFPSAQKALGAALLIRDAAAGTGDDLQLHLRIGIHTGDVVQARGDFFGRVVNKAARILSCAAPDEILLSDATRDMAGEDAGFRFSGRRSVRLPGFEGEHGLCRLDG
jgi:class 3 adenylate cyclase